MRAISRLTEPDTKSPMTNSAVTYRDRLDNDTQPDDRGANVMMEELDNTTPLTLPDSKKSKRPVSANIKRGIRLDKKKKEAIAERDTQKRDLLEKLAIVQGKHDGINDNRKRKYSDDDDGDTKPASKP